MRRTATTIVFFVLVLGGCNRQTQVPPEKQVPPVTYKAEFFGYFLEIETAGSSSGVSSRIDSSQGKGADETVVRMAEYEWGDNKLMIYDGALTFNKKPFGTLQKGDRIRVDQDGQLTVNGKQPHEQPHGSASFSR